MSRKSRSRRRGTASVVLLGTILLLGGVLAAWKTAAVREANAAAAKQPEPMEAVTSAVARERPYRETTTSIGTVLALRSITLRNEVAGTVRHVTLTPGRVVEAGALLVALDVSVEEAELKAEEAQAALAQTTLDRLQRLREHEATSQEEVDQARAQRDVAVAQIARTRAIIARKMIRAPFRARVGLTDVHEGQYLNEGTQLTTLQGVADASHVDFAVSQQVGASLRVGEGVQVFADDASPIPARIVAIDARVDPTTRNAMVRASIEGGDDAPPPGASVRVVVPVGPARSAVVVPASALRKGPAGDHVFVLAADKDGKARAHMRPVRSGAVVGDEVVILDGLAAGETVAASGSFKLREAVLVATAGTPAGGKEAR
ncbi:MAG TPA: efflux RND transporter periplasmic adaptor subunit [Longimicrobiales bacterium]|nr:efflux RND transporter periplasmic adaptor subunit [Longimicrobiales bacterium]